MFLPRAALAAAFALLLASCGGGGSAPPPAPVAEPPSILSIESLRQNVYELVVSFPAVSGTTFYDLEYRTGDAAYAMARQIAATALKVRTTVELPTPVPETGSVTFRVGKSPVGTATVYSKEMSITPLAPALIDVVALDWDPAPVDTIQLTWTQYSRVATETVVESRKVDPAGNPLGEWTVIGIVAPTVTRYSFNRTNGLKELSYFQFRLHNRNATAVSFLHTSQAKFFSLYIPKDLAGTADETGCQVAWRNDSEATATLALYYDGDINKQLEPGMQTWTLLAVLPAGTTGYRHIFPYAESNFHSYALEARAPGATGDDCTQPARVLRPPAPGPLNLHYNLQYMPTTSMPPRLDGQDRWLTCLNAMDGGYVGVPAEGSWLLYDPANGTGSRGIAPPGAMPDSAGGVNIVYSRLEQVPDPALVLYHGRYKDGAWTISEIARQPRDAFQEVEIAAALDAQDQLQVVWRNGPRFTWAANAGGIWTTAPVEAAAFTGAWMKLGLATGPDGVLDILRARYDGDYNLPSGFDLIQRRADGTWATTPVPFAANPYSENLVRLLRSGNRRVLVRAFNAHEPWPIVQDLFEAVELTAAGWGLPERLPLPQRFTYTGFDAALSRDGARLAVLYSNGYYDVLAVREAGLWSTSNLVLLTSNLDYSKGVAFDSRGKVRIDEGTTAVGLDNWFSFQLIATEP